MMSRLVDSDLRKFGDIDDAARRLFRSYQAQGSRWHGLDWDGLREETKRLLRREAMWTMPRPPRGLSR